MPVEFLPAADRPDLLRPLFAAYADMLYGVDEGMHACLANQNYDAELAHLREKYPSDRARLYVVLYDGQIAGMGGVLQLSPDCGEIKRIYLDPAFRGKGIGLTLMEQLLADARRFGYRHVRLDTFPAMVEALGLYRKLGFYEIPRYNDNPLARAMYFQKDL